MFENLFLIYVYFTLPRTLLRYHTQSREVKPFLSQDQTHICSGFTPGQAQWMDFVVPEIRPGPSTYDSLSYPSNLQIYMWMLKNVV